MKIALIYFTLGLASGIIIEIFKHIVLVFKNNAVAQIICDIISTTVICTVFTYLNHHFFYGEMRLYLILFFIFGMFAERKTFGKIFAKLFFILYNWISKGLKWLKSTTLGKFITK